MYGTKFTIEFFKFMLLYDFNLMNSKVVELDELYRFTKDHFQIHLVVFEKNNKYTN